MVHGWELGKRASLVLLALALGSAPARAQELDGGAADAGPAPVAEALPAPGPGGEETTEMDLFALESQMKEQVASATKTAQRGVQAPAIITVVTAEELQARGYTSLAEVLRAVPGFYDVDDLATHNVGVRGINGGVQASGSILKLMIDGRPVDFRPSTGNFFGEELIPLEAIARVEIIRGPASALYGANAFLGVVNVITRSGADIGGVHLVGVGATTRTHPGGGGGVVVGRGSGEFDLLVAAEALYLDRGGLTLPGSSPILAGGAVPPPPTEHDLARPKTLFARFTDSQLVGGALTLSASIQNLDAQNAFQSFAPGSSRTREALLNQNYAASWTTATAGGTRITAGGGFFTSSPTRQQQLDVGRPDYVLLRQVAASGFDASASLQTRVLERLALTVGADFVREDQELQTFDQLLTADVYGSDGQLVRTAGTVLPGPGQGEHQVFYNEGGYGQALWDFDGAWSAIAGARLDVHNIYGVNASPRAGLVYAPAERPLSAKLLYGSSFKAPSAEQLYAQPLGVGGLRGNPDLMPQTAHTLEAAAGYALPHDLGEVTVNAFGTYVLSLVKFQQTGLYLRAQNDLDELVVGGELDARIRPAKPVHLRLSAGVARTVFRVSEAIIVGEPEPTNPLFPPYQVHLLADFLLPWAGLRLSPELSLIGPRAASQSNALLAGQTYALSPYLYTAAALSTAGRHLLPGRETSLALRVTDLLNAGWPEPGFGGVDTPSRGLTAQLTVVQSL